ncbi:TspO/MBR family protein [Salinisphaera japonica]|uniref:TspO/MBR family protein n=1 Tax=Salinisphaera japonica TaxID=1304270 RepID=UPI001FE3CBEB|nr:TspO/MBR family protein [Salinisphaera japonica]
MSSTAAVRFHPVRAAIIVAALVVLTSLTGSVARPGAWYHALSHPTGTPPDLLFPIAWTILYIVMAVAAWRVWRAEGFGRGMALFIVQLALNALWMPVAFGAQWLAGALVVVLALWAAVAALAVVFFRADRIAGWLVAPYLAWVS